MLNRLAVLAATVFVALGSAGPVHAADQLIWRGDHVTARSIMTELSREYAREKRGTISMQAFSTVSGLDAVASGSADIAGSARGRYDERPEEAGIDFVPVALDAAVLVTHPSNPVTSLSIYQIRRIYFGKITNWSEVGGPDRPINLYGIAAPLDGVEFSMRELIWRKGSQKVSAPRLYLNTTKLEEAIAIDPAGLGLSTLTGSHGNAALKPLAVEGIPASTATIADGSYPFFITLYMARREDSPKMEAIDRFLAFLDSDPAKDILRRHQLVPFSDAGEIEAQREQQLAFIQSRLDPTVGEPAPMAAPRATLESRMRAAPTAESTRIARENLARAEREKAEREAAQKAATPGAAAGSAGASGGR